MIKLGFLLCSVLLNSVLCDYEIELIDDIKKGFAEHLRTGIFPNYYDEAVKKFQLPGLLRDDEISEKKFKQKTQNLQDGALCSLCIFAANLIVEERKLGMTREQMLAELTTICVQFKVENERVCRGTIDTNMDILLRLMDKHQDLIGERLCDVVLTGTCGTNATFVEWTVNLPEGHSPERKPSASTSEIKILQITDLHYDPHYTPGKSNQCGEPLCCQDDQIDGNVTDGTACGYWGDYNSADTSEQLFEAVLSQAQTLQPTIVYYTGDIVSHRVWSTSVANNTRDVQYVLSKLKEAFPEALIYMTLGNHEPHPLNVYNVEEEPGDQDLSTRWLYNTVMDELDQYLPDKAKQTIVQGGYYVVSPTKGLKTVVNSNVAQNLNWWLIDREYDPFDQLAWLVETLKEAEDNNESVHILSHFPPAYKGILDVWQREYYKIVKRFANTITLQLNGHTHKHEWSLFYNDSDYSQVINKVFNGASVTTFDATNPNFVIYTVDSDKFDLINVDLWTFNITQANLQPSKSPDWYNLCSFKDAYNIESMSLENLGKLVLDMTQNHSRLVDYHTFRYKNSDVGNNIGCDEQCQKKYLCNIATSYHADNTKCEELTILYDQN